MSFFPYGSWDVCRQSADSVHPFRTRIFPSSWESNRLCRKANPPETFVPAPCKAGTRRLTVRTHHIHSRHPSSILSITSAVFPESHRAPGAVMVWGWETLRMASHRRHTRRADPPGLALDHVHHALGAADSFTARSHGRVWYLIPDDMTGISCWHLLSVHVRNVSLPAPQAGGPAESVRRAVMQPPVPQGCVAK